MEWLVIWGVGQATWSVFHPILNNLATDVAKDIAKSYVGKCFERVFSGLHKKPLARATGLAVKELLELIDNELIRAGLDDDGRRAWIGDVEAFLQHDNVRQAIASLFLDPDYRLDPKTFVTAWQQLPAAHTLPDGFSWQFIAKRLADKVAAIRVSTKELQDTFQALAAVGDSAVLREIAGLPPEFDLDAYREALVERFGNVKLDSLDTSGAYYNEVRLWSVFVPQSVRECHEYTPQLLEMPKEHLQRLVDKGELDAGELAEAERLQDTRRQQYVSQPLRPVLEVIGAAGSGAAAGSHSHGNLVILGDPGSGKSSLLQFVALRWARIEDANLRYTQPLPLLIELRDYNRWDCSSGKSFPRYLHEAPNWHRLNQQTLDHLLQQPGRVVLLLDGLDEVFDPAERKDVINDIHRFSNEYPHTRIVTTSRVVGYQPQRLRDADFRHFMLQDLDESQIVSFLDRWHDVTFDDPTEAASKNQRLQTAIRGSKSIAMLAGNPLLLTMMAILNRHQELPRDRTDLYQQCARLLLHQWDIERALKNLPGQTDEIGLREKTDILRTIAFAMQTGLGRHRNDQPDRASDRFSGEPQASAKRLIAANGSNFIDGQTLTSLIEDYMHDKLHFTQAKAAARALVEQLRTRNFILCYLGADSYAFVHRTFLEYFCAADIVHQFNVAKTLSEPDLIALFDTHCRDDDWREVLRLICGQIDEQFVGRIVEHLATRTDLRKWNGWFPLPELPLAIYCLCEVSSVNRLEHVGQVLLASTAEVARQSRQSGREFLMDQLLPACGELGERWPGRSWLADREQALLDGLSPFNYGNDFWMHLIAYVSANRQSIERFAVMIAGAGEDTDAMNRCPALRVLAKKWPDENTRELLAQRAVQDDHFLPRQTALQVLAGKWPDENTRKLLAERAPQDRVAASILGKMHSEFGRVVFTEDFTGWGPYLDPRQPISREHIERAAKQENIPADKIDETVRSLSEHLGWDITKGLGQ